MQPLIINNLRWRIFVVFNFFTTSQPLRRLAKPGRLAGFVRHCDAVNGLTIHLDLSNTPNPNLGAATEDLPASNLVLDPRTLK